MGAVHLNKWDRLPDLCGAAFFLLILLGVWMCGTVKAGEGIPKRQGFYLDEDGELYFYDRHGEMVTDSLVAIQDREGEYRYYFLEDGRAAEGLIELEEDAWYYFDENHLMLVSGVQVLGSETWYFGEDGKADWVLHRWN